MLAERGELACASRRRRPLFAELQLDALPARRPSAAQAGRILLAQRAGPGRADQGFARLRAALDQRFAGMKQALPVPLTTTRVGGIEMLDDLNDLLMPSTPAVDTQRDFDEFMIKDGESFSGEPVTPSCWTCWAKRAVAAQAVKPGQQPEPGTADELTRWRSRHLAFRVDAGAGPLAHSQAARPKTDRLAQPPA